MEFFKSFNGNNILFIIWLLMIIFTIYDIEIKGVKISDKEYIDKKQQTDEVNFKFESDNIQRENLDNCQNEINDVKQKFEESDKNSNRGDI